MKINSSIKKLLLLSASGLSFNIYADNTASIPEGAPAASVSELTAAEKLEVKKTEADLASLNKVKDKNDLSLEVSSLDNAWKNRETLENQNKILEFFQSEPAVPQDFEIAWRVSRFIYYIGNFGVGEHLTSNEHIKIFEYGYKSGEIAKNLKPDRVEGFYWYAINLGSYGLAKGIFSALKNAPLGRDALLEAAKIDPTYHWAGPYRILGRYYQELPSLISFGDKVKAEEFFKKAIKIAPEFRLNTVYLGLLRRDNGEDKDALKLLHEAEEKINVDGKVEEAHYKQNLAKDIKKLEKS